MPVVCIRKALCPLSIRRTKGHYARKDGTVSAAEAKKYKHKHNRSNPECLVSLCVYCNIHNHRFIRWSQMGLSTRAPKEQRSRHRNSRGSMIQSLSYRLVSLDHTHDPMPISSEHARHYSISCRRTPHASLPISSFLYMVPSRVEKYYSAELRDLRCALHGGPTIFEMSGGSIVERN